MTSDHKSQEPQPPQYGGAAPRAPVAQPFAVSTRYFCLETTNRTRNLTWFILIAYREIFLLPKEDNHVPRSSSRRPSSGFPAMPNAPQQHLVTIFSTRNVFQIDALNDFFLAKIATPLEAFLDGKTSGHFSLSFLALRSTLKAVALGPLGFDAHLLRSSMKGAGYASTHDNEKALVEILLGRESSEIRWLITAYRIRYGRNLLSDMDSETSGNTSKSMFFFSSERKSETNELTDLLFSVQNGVGSTAPATVARGSERFGVDTITFFEILINRSTPHIARVIAEYGLNTKLGTIRSGLLHIVHGAKPKRDGQEMAMKGFGTDDDALVWRVVRAYWDPLRLQRDRVRGETSGAYRDMLIALIRSNEKKT
ncbi:hypothetical protein BDQ17DRAFT_1346193 [Cyathus striatus]|nr:hypothetical protein BDQ17DRAFT_1346193 [Cyathus striatus]